jgi:peptidoglycan/LPS O-acetylase OafA/YrhL
MPKYYRPDIDGLRCIAIIIVVVFHAFPGRLSGGFVGVDVFFVISGYLITSVIVREVQNNSFRITGFYSRRIKRIFPALGAVLIACLAAGWTLLVAPDYMQLSLHVAGGAGFVSNLILWSQINYFDSSVYEKPLLHLWSLGVEEQFYIAWPLIIWSAVRLELGLKKTVVPLTLISFGICYYLTQHEPSSAFYLPTSRSWQLSTGGIVALSPNSIKKSALRHVASVCGLLLVAGSAVYLNHNSRIPGALALLPVTGAALIIAAGSNAAGNRLLATKPFVWVGLISYPLYLWHWPILSFASILNFGGQPPAYVRVGLLGASFVVATVTYFMIERPLRQVRASALAAGMAVIFCTALTFYATRGVPQRAVNRDSRLLFVSSYRERYARLGREYREECNFFNPHTYRERPSIAASCTKAGVNGTYLLWGDSHAQAIGYGLRRLAPPGIQLAQVATSGCHPFIINATTGSGDGEMGRACRRSNEVAAATIARLKPSIVFLAQQAWHDSTDWNLLAKNIMAMGAGKVVLIGPTPQWQPSLAASVVRYHWPLRPGLIREGLDRTILDTDKVMIARYQRSSALTYISLVGALCRAEGCTAEVDGELLVMDYGHLSPAGAMAAARVVRGALDTHQPRHLLN